MNWLHELFGCKRCGELERSLHIAEGEISTLKQWNMEQRGTIELLYSKLGIVTTTAPSNMDMSNMKPIQQVENWRTAKAKFERAWKR